MNVENLPSVATRERRQYTFTPEDFNEFPYGVCAECIRHVGTAHRAVRIIRVLPNSLAADLIGNVAIFPSIAFNEFRDLMNIPTVFAFVDLVRVLAHGVTYADEMGAPMGDGIAVTRRNGTDVCAIHAVYPANPKV